MSRWFGEGTVEFWNLVLSWCWVCKRAQNIFRFKLKLKRQEYQKVKRNRLIVIAETPSTQMVR